MLVFQLHKQLDCCLILIFFRRHQHLWDQRTEEINTLLFENRQNTGAQNTALGTEAVSEYIQIALRQFAICKPLYCKFLDHDTAVIQAIL